MNKRTTSSTSSNISTFSSSSSSRRRRPRKEENDTEHPQPRNQGRAKYFLLGFSVATILLTGAAITTTYGMCKGVLTSSSCRITLPTKDSQRTTPKRKRGLLSLFRKKRNEKIEPGCSHLEPKDYVCQWIQHSLQEMLSNMRFVRSDNRMSNQPVNVTATTDDTGNHQPRPKTDFPTAFTSEALPLSPHQTSLIEDLGQQIRTVVPDWEERVTEIPWGGPRNDAPRSTQWWAPASPSTSKTTTPLKQLDGGNLLFSYLRIMNWPQDLRKVYFPFKACKKQGCPAPFALNHTLNFREIYQPWLVTPTMKAVNAKGLVYHQGFSPSLDGEHAPHGIVWLRPGLVARLDEVFYARTLVRELERSVALSMEQSRGRVGKFNVVVSGKDFSFGAMPSLRGIKAFVTILQDHYVDRLGVVLLADMGRICEILLKLFLPLITEEVRNKIVLVPHDKNERQAIFETVLGEDNIPTWLGGRNDYRFNVDQHYASDDAIYGTDVQATEYLSLMPYHS
ncbi:CRAL/TRIO domain containing protein [Nitzschia inconspicua]|uniref:CRAL/TRIO domain containing protein n=1 Tax=Nitzschia inconspicua TaxID=303405 RepID=A0A9K3KQP3_9STRA|nr:CRAL/TRIO domain containing protein [Nitzschia inconspicua]